VSRRVAAIESLLAIALLVVLLVPVAAGQTVWPKGPKLPMAKTWLAEKAKLPPYTPPRTPGGEPDLQGIWDGAGGDNNSYLEDHEYLDDTTPAQESFVSDPPDGKIPALTPAAQRHEAAIARLNDARNGEGLADSWVDRSMWDRCITRGLPGSMMPNIYGNAYQILQTPGYVAIRYEMVHDTRIIPLDGRPHLGEGIREYFGDARGRWEGNTLVVESTNFTDRSHMGYNNQYNSRAFRLTERFTPIAADRLYWEVTLDDPETWTRPWTFAMPLTKDDRHAIFEYACHEGNYGLVNLLSGARAEEGRRGR